ncbi:inositol monophosphatase [Saccharomonospora piscinae]|uniref:inositol monophosphatase family protein n=1 Tax=Saccharomonospora piscinae TaxID=687388 RepID=UPI001106F71D|nr:inositol monophosphatase family protein [Saccharomonospora piscinae]TLW93675.1 inositol monophosphatase [Saccharomonospora piscinae]
MAPPSPSPARPLDDGLVSRALEVAVRLAGDAGDVLAATAGRAAGADGGDSPFAWVRDTGATLERHTRRVLSAEFPGIPVTGDPAPSTPYRWLVAALDGRANYFAGLPGYAYSLALVDRTGPVVGVVADPAAGRSYAAARGRGVRTEDGPVRVSRHHGGAAGGTALAGALVCTEFADGGVPPVPGPAEFVRRATGAGAAVRVLGSAATAVTQVALGRAAAAVLPRYREPVVAGALALAVETGAVVATPGDGLLVAAPGVAGEVAAWLAT